MIDAREVFARIPFFAEVLSPADLDGLAAPVCPFALRVEFGARLRDMVLKQLEVARVRGWFDEQRTLQGVKEFGEFHFNFCFASSGTRNTSQSQPHLGQ